MDNIATLIRDGTGQSDRMAAALRPGYFHPDESSLPELLFLGSRFASQLSYYGTDDRPSGDWYTLFANDASALLGIILTESARTEPWRRMLGGFLVRMQAFLMKLAPCPSPEAVPLYQLDKTIREWAVHCRRCDDPAAQRVGEAIDELIASVLDHARGTLASYLARHDERHAEFVPKASREDTNGTRLHTPPPEASYSVISRFLGDNFGAYVNALDAVHKIAEEQFALSLPSGEHDPAIGLYLAFAQLFLKARDCIGDFGQRQLRFYYERILRFRRRRAQGDNAYLVFVPDGTLVEAPVRSGTQFIGGEDADGKELIYAADDEILVTDARVAALHTLYFDRDPLHSPEKDLNYATAAWTTALPAAGDDQYRPLFGTSKKSGDSMPNEDARLGFAIASPVLLLNEGKREIRIDLHFEGGSETIEWLVDRLRSIIGNSSTEGAFYKAFADVFRIRLTTSMGWRDVPVFVPVCRLVDAEVAADCLRLEISLPESFPPVIAYDPKLHTGPFEADGAIVSFELQSDTYLYPYDFFSRQSIRWIDIKVKVRGCRDLTLYNNNGELSAATPFAPFGPLPRIGSHFIVGSKEAFGKQLTDLTLNVEWDGLPTNGFENHYRAYEADIHARSFRVAFSALGDNVWLPGKTAERIEHPLFEREDTERGTYDCASLLPYLQPSDAVDGRYGPNARGGFIRLTLSAPAQAFGHAEYPQLLARALTRNSRLDSLGAIRRIIGRKGMLPIPEAPYTPQISGISVDYVARARISPHLANAATTRERFFHLHPFGIESVSLSTHGAMPLVPITLQHANLYIGIDASEPSGPLNLYFHLRNDSALDPGAEPPRFTWSCLNGTRWQVLENFRILSDTTRGFLTSGVVRLDLPAMARAVHMPGNHYWLRVATDGDASALCSVYAIHAHGLRVHRVCDESRPTHVDALPAASIQSAKTALPGIAQILQPADSFGGRQEETVEAMTIRASERLRHRQRAVTPWDYERLVLQRFPRLHKVKCFPNTVSTSDPMKCHRPGSVLIVVVPQHGEVQDNGEALKENVLLLEEIKAYLKSVSSPFVEIDVRNPMYERIQVRCAVDFRGAGNEGMSLKRLNQDIRNYISPWNDLGNTANFGWSLRAQEIQGYLHGLPYVQSVKGLSMLRVVESGKDYYDLTDTAALVRGDAAEVVPLYPWSLAIPFRHHLIEAYDESNGPWRTGISRLRVGTTFIVSGN